MLLNDKTNRNIILGPVAVLSTDLFEGSLGSEEFVEKADGDAEHGGQRQAPAKHLAPPRVHVLVVVGQRLVVDQVEQEDALNQREDGTESHQLAPL